MRVGIDRRRLTECHPFLADFARIADSGRDLLRSCVV